MSPVFADLRQLTYSSGCDSSFSDLAANAVNCDPWNRLFNYTLPSLEAFRALGLDASSTEFLGAFIGIFGLFAALLFIFALVKGLACKFLVSTVFMLSFPFQLAVERGNHDLLVFGMCLLIPFQLFFDWPRKFKLLNSIVVSFLSFSAAAMKVFPVLGLAPWSLGILLKSRRKDLRSTALMVFSASCVGILIQLGDLSHIVANTPKPDGVVSFGLLAAFQSKMGESLGIAFVIAKIVILVLTGNLMLNRRFDPLFGLDVANQGYDSPSRQAAVMFSFMTLSVWLISRSFDYRLIVTLGLLPYFLDVFSSIQLRLGWAKYGLSASFLFLWFEQYIGGMLDYVADILMQPVLMGFVFAFLLRSHGKQHLCLRKLTP